MNSLQCVVRPNGHRTGRSRAVPDGLQLGWEVVQSNTSDDSGRTNWLDQAADETSVQWQGTNLDPGRSFSSLAVARSRIRKLRISTV